MFAAGFLVYLGGTGVALAEEEFPGPFSEAAGYSCPVACTVCHTTPEGGLANINPFGATVLGNGLKIGDPASLATVVANIRANPTLDSDGDGFFDWQEFENQTDPSKANLPISCPTYGCGARIAPLPSDGQSRGGVLLLLGLGLGVVVRRALRSRAVQSAG